MKLNEQTQGKITDLLDGIREDADACTGEDTDDVERYVDSIISQAADIRRIVSKAKGTP